ncbi:MAG: hypothetical protein VYE73_16480, partial [Acidobacteriota bacterium]|nr:hypothetical protein [Acidobacteriota bacterium]
MATAMTLAAQVATDPEVEVQASAATPRIGESFELEVAVIWSGTESGGELLPPKIEIPAGVEAGELRATSAVGGRLG